MEKRRIGSGVWHRRSDGSRDKADGGLVGFGDRSRGRGTFGGEFGARHCNQCRTLRRRCATVPQPSEMPFGVVHAVRRGIAVLDGGLRRARSRGGFGFFVIHFHNVMTSC